MEMLSFLPTWLIVVAVLLIIVIFLVRSSNNINVLYFVRQNFFYFFLAVILILLSLAVLNIHQNNNIDFSSKDGVVSAVKIYYAWGANVFRNIGKVTGYATEQDWTNSTKTKINNKRKSVKK